MNKGPAAINSTASPARANGSYAKCGKRSEKVSESNPGSGRPQDRDRKSRHRPEHVNTHSQDPREKPVPVSTSNGAARTHQRRWSADFCKCGTSPVIIVTKNKKEPQPPQRGVSLLRPHTASSRYSDKRNSCPPIGVCSSPSHSSSSTSSSSSSCSSPPPVQTSVITGHDPRGWKLRPKSSAASPRARANRLSLQIPLPDIYHEPESSAAANAQSVNTALPDRSPTTKPPIWPKPSRRRHSDSSAFLRSLASPLPVVTLEELSAVNLRAVGLLDECDDVFGGGEEEEVKMNTRPRKIAPAVPEKTAMARQIAQLMAQSRQRRRPVTANGEIPYTRVIKPKPAHRAKERSGLNATITGRRGDASRDRERTNPRFPG
ncbi:serine/arginine repetitive matrix protein 1-like [Etheostoma cragini]|uniref:serine/arginine repetitive matrix protein 1-like n=1 Tax=Etheostoma cragini TaxID=417921 RepID=UPI00155F300D|nr:serine/arginine repetitive matrix protein 1-like [Etheostoma cragini]